MTDRISRLANALKASYRIEREVGSGGMAVVYLARDLKHDRPVALKVVRPDVAATLGTERFLREIRVTANLHHPGILQLYDSGSVDGVPYFVMPFVSGETLRQRLDRERQLPIGEALSIAREVATALDYAHGHDLVHRDVKPANILLHEGRPLVADFGIALAMAGAGGQRLTGTGLSLGTPAYMSPEQASGDRDVDTRSDVYSLGAVLYEMLAGDPPFGGSSAPAVVARILSERPLPLRRIRETVPSHVEAAVDRALAKAPPDRFPTAAAFAEAIDPEAARKGIAGVVVTRVQSMWRRGVAVAVLGAMVILVGRGLLGRRVTSTRPGDGMTIRPLTNFVGWEWAPTWSPDRSQIAYSHIVGGDADIATLSVAGGDPHILTADSPADEFIPAWSPDGSKIAFISDRGSGADVFWIAPSGGAEHKIAETNIPFLERMGAWAAALGVDPWSPDSRRLLFSRLGEAGETAVWRVDLTTGEQVQLTRPAPGVEDGHASWSADGERISFSRSDRGVTSLWLMPAAGGEATPIAVGEPVNGSSSWYPDNRHLAISSVRSGAPNVWEWDIERGTGRALTTGAGADLRPSVASDGSIAYVQFGHEIDLYWLRLDAPEAADERLTAFTGDNFGARVSPDGGRVAYYSRRTGNHEIWVLDRLTGQHRQLTDDPAADRLLDWSPDGREIVFLSDRQGAVRLWVLEVETGVARRLSDQEIPWSQHMAEAQGGPRWAPDGSHIGYLAPTNGGEALWLIDPDGDHARPTDLRGVLSFGWYRDGKRVLYTRRATDGSGLVEIRAANLETGEDRLLRAGALAEVAVSPDGRALTFISAVSHFTMELYVLALSPGTGADGLPRAAGEPRQVTFGEGAWHVHSGGWSPDGTAIVYSRDRDFGDIYVIERAR